MKKYLPKHAAYPGAGSPRRVLSSPPLEIHLSRAADWFDCIQLKEPELIFKENHRCVDPMTGLAAYGPYGGGQARGRNQLGVGIVGTSEAIEKVLALFHEISKPIEHDPNLDSILHPSFPGLNPGKPFSVDIVSHPSWQSFVSPQALQHAEEARNSDTKFEMFSELFGKPIREMSRLEFPPNVVVCAATPFATRSHVNAACAQSLLPIEIVCDGLSPKPDGEPEGEKGDRATRAWNLAVRLLHKAGVVPWRLADAAGDSCFVGISCYPASAGAASNLWTHFAHIVTDLGEGYVLQGDTCERQPPDGVIEASPHLEEEQAAKLISRSLKVFEKHAGRSPAKVVVHKKSPYGEAERMGFEDALREIERQALVSIRRSEVFFLRPGRKPISRGTAVPLGQKLGLVYLSGYVPFLRCYPGNRMPEAIEITENWGSMTFLEAARDLLRLTKLNFSSPAFCSEDPATLAVPRHAREIFNILGQPDLVLDDRSSL